MNRLVAYFFNKIKETKDVQFIILSTVTFYSIIWLLNPSNKMLAVISLALGVVILLKIKSLRNTLVIAYFILFVIITGKQYDFIIVPPGIFPVDRFPMGYYVNVVITPSVIISCIMAILIMRAWITGKLKKKHLTLPDILLILGSCIWLLSDMIASPMKDLAVILWIFSLPNLVVYFYIRWLCNTNKKMLIWCFSILSSLVFIESCIAIIQFIHGSPLGKSIEFQKEIELFGDAVDEYSYRLRPVGTFEHANVLGAFLAIFTPLTLYLVSIRSTITKQFILFIGVIAIGLTLSRGAWLGLVAAFLLQASAFEAILKNILLKLHKATIVLLLFFGCCFFVFIIGPRIYASFFSLFDTGGAYVRNIQSSIAWQLILQSPFFGVGTAMSVPKGLPLDDSGLLLDFPAQVHNRFMLLAAENGVPMLITYFLFLISSVMLLYKTTKNTSDQKKNLWRLYLGSVITILIIGFFQPYSLETNVTLLFSLIYNHVS